MGDEQKKILSMVAEGTISVEEAQKLLAALGEGAAPSPTPTRDNPIPNPKFLRVVVEDQSGEDGKSDKVNIRIPLSVIKAGLKIASFMPGKLQTRVNDALHEKGFDIDLNKLDAAGVDQLLAGLKEFSVDVDSKNKERVRIFCE
jgi:hypothetical protein